MTPEFTETDFHGEFQALVASKMPDRVEVEVTEWAGCDEDWDDPVYVTAHDPTGEATYFDAVCDLEHTPTDELAEFVVAQLKFG